MMTFMPLAYEHLRLVGSTVCQSLTGTGCSTSLPNVGANSSTIPSVLQIVFGVMAVLSMLMIVIAGLRFVSGGSNPQEVSKARGTVIYALIGLLIALAAEALVSFVLDKL